MTKNTNIRKCQFPGCDKPASVFLLSVPGKEGDYCLNHAKQIWDEHFSTLKKESEKNEKTNVGFNW